MSIFKDSATVLKITKLNNKEFLYTIFTDKFWKIVTKKKFSKKEKALDLWYYINCEIETSKNSDISKIWWIKIVNEFLNINRNFNEINNYLILINTIIKKTAVWIENIKINEVIKRINIYNNTDLEVKIILAQIKIINLLWELNINNKNETISKILKFINNNDIETILKLTWLNEEIKKDLQSIL